MEKPWKGSYTLTGHTAAVVEAVTTLVDELSEGLFAQFGLQQYRETLRATAVWLRFFMT
jgi:CRISPR-associated endonuclease/helicase Cas3